MIAVHFFGRMKTCALSSVLFLFLLLVGFCAKAQYERLPDSEPASIVDNFIQHFNAQEWDSMKRYVTPSTRLLVDEVRKQFEARAGVDTQIMPNGFAVTQVYENNQVRVHVYFGSAQGSDDTAFVLEKVEGLWLINFEQWLLDNLAKQRAEAEAAASELDEEEQLGYEYESSEGLNRHSRAVNGCVAFLNAYDGEGAAMFCSPELGSFLKANSDNIYTMYPNDLEVKGHILVGMSMTGPHVGEVSSPSTGREFLFYMTSSATMGWVVERIVELK